MSRTNRLHRHDCGLQFEALESRQMLAGNVTATLTGGNLLVKGDAGYNSLAITSGATPGSVVVMGLADVVGEPTKVNGSAKVEFKGVTGNIAVDLGAGIDVLGLTKLKAARDVTITDSAGETTVYVGRNLSAAAGTALDGVTNGPVTIGGNLSITTGPAADVVVLGEFGDGQPLPGQALTVGGSLTVSMGDGGTRNDDGDLGRTDVLNVGRNGKADNFAVKVGKNFLADLGSGNAGVEMRSLTVGGSLDIRSQNTGYFVPVGVFVGYFFHQYEPMAVEGSTALRVDGNASIRLGPGTGEAVHMTNFSIGGNFTIDVPSTSPAVMNGIDLESSVKLTHGTVGGQLHVTLGRQGQITNGDGVYRVDLAGMVAKSLVINGSGRRDFIIVGASATGRRSQFQTMTINLGDGDDSLDLSGTTVTGLATLDGGAGNDVLTIQTLPAGSVKLGQRKITRFES